MTIKYSIQYYYLPRDSYSLIEEFLKCSGDYEKRLITEYLCDWIDCNREYYLDLAKQDAQTRNISFSEWGEIVVDRGMKALPSYKQALVELHNNPLLPVLLGRYRLQRFVSYITISKQNVALLKCAIHYDKDTKVNWISRVINKYIEDNALGYIAQIKADDLASWNDTEKNTHDLYYLDRNEMLNGKYNIDEIADEVVDEFKFNYIIAEKNDVLDKVLDKEDDYDEDDYIEDDGEEITDEELKKYIIKCFERKFKTIKLLDRRTIEHLKKAENLLSKKQNQFSGNQEIYECLSVLKILISKLDSFN